jgi:hypothetical protein
MDFVMQRRNKKTIMKIITTLSLLFIGLCAFAQNVSLTIFNNNGQQFFVIMNGIRQNSIPQTSVKIGGMTTGAYELKLIFADGKTGDINKKIYVDATGDYLARVVFKGKKRKLQWFGMADGTQPIPAGGTNIQYRPNDQSVYSDQSSTMNNGTTNNGQYGTQGQQTGTGQYGAPTGSTQQTGTYQTGQTQTSGQASQQGSATTQTGQAGMNTNVVITDPNMSGQTGTVQTTTTTTGSQTGQTGGTITTGTTVTDPNGSTGQTGGQFGVNVNINVQDPTTNGGTGGIGMTTTTTGNGQTQTMGTSTTVTDPNNASGQFGMDMNVTGTGMGQGTATSTSTTTSSSSSTSTQNLPTGQVVNDSHTYQQTTSVTQNGQTTTTSQSGYGTQQGQGQTTMTTGTTVVPTGGTYSCTMILADADAFVTRLNAATFDADKREMIEQELKSYCMTSDQAYRIVHALTFDADRLDMSKFLYDRMTDKVNGKRLLELLTFELDQDEFKQYMQTH